MRADWVAASVRARSMAQRRVGAGTCREVAAMASLPTAAEALADSVYGPDLTAARSLGDAQHATRRTVLWQLRVLAGWLPAGGTPLIRAAAARFEADNIIALAAALHTGTLPAGTDMAPAPLYDLGGLATAWPRLRTAESPETLHAMLAASPWGDPGTAAQLPDILTAVWLRRLAGAAAGARPWAVSAAVLLAARLLLVDRTRPPDRLVSLLRPLLGTGWTDAASLPELAVSLSPAAGRALSATQDPQGLWRAEAQLAAQVETDGFGLLRAGLPGPDVVLGAMAVLAADAWRVRAALAAAAAGTGGSEVLDAVA
ncbi:V-type ATPase subunit [Arthrobacter sp. zg-Y40]|uniref:V-type ATPase subunit n=1 Tax=Arthrobacter sp. zg-Y40 TaxID=2886939 RepID=UPI001D134B45|nr:V-type ATPase subunit [Arthrobacter sp. zg-Y40]MCC3279545.1 V-type ATPase subunit [Arthrobacter sp. zg-Y40]